MIDSDLRLALKTWFLNARRDLPWRHSFPDGNRDPYRVLVSEIMLQQTQVKVVLPYYENWMKQFPNLKSLAQAPEEAVLAAWSGLGYYRRARSLHQCAQVIFRDYQGQFPKTLEQLLQLPGVGPYTAGAISSLAYGQNSAILDGNLIRVFCRLKAWSGDASKEPLKSKLWDLASQWAQTEPRLSNEALMEFGALCCTPKNPQCAQCPLAYQCEAYALDRCVEFPTPKTVLKETWQGEMWWIVQNGKILLCRSSTVDFGKDYWIPPLFSQDQIPNPRLNAQRSLIIKHSITKYKIQLHNKLWQAPMNWAAPNSWGEAQWVDLADFESWVHFNLALKGKSLLSDFASSS